MVEIFRKDTFFGARNENKRKVWMRFGNLAELGDEMLTDATSAWKVLDVLKDFQHIIEHLL